MNLAEWITAAASVLTVLVPVIGSLMWMALRLARLEVKVDIVQSFLMRRMVVEGVSAGRAELGSPYHLTDKGIASAMEVLGGMEQQLKAFYAAHHNGQSDRQLLFELEDEFGAEIVTKVCIPKKMDKGECLLMALSVANGFKPIEVDI